MCFGEVQHVDVVAYRGSVRRGPVGSEDRDLVPLFERDLQDEWNQVGFRSPGSSPADLYAPATLK